MPTDTAPTLTDAEKAAAFDELVNTLAKLETRYARDVVRYDAAGMDLAVLGLRARLNLVLDLQDQVGR